MDEDREPSTTSGTIAVVNLHAQIEGLAVRVPGTAPGAATAERSTLIDLLTLRGHVLGRIADYERAADLAEQLVRGTRDIGRQDNAPQSNAMRGSATQDNSPQGNAPHNNTTPDEGTALLARARTRATFHRFAEALADLDDAERSGLDRAVLAAERAVILQALGCHAQAEQLHCAAAKGRPDFSTLGGLAVLHAERGEVAEAERLFTEARRRYRGTSPFPLASLDYRRGLMWFRAGNLTAARIWFDAGRRRVPAYAPALGHLAEIDAALGDHRAAIDRLRPLASVSDDPAYAASLACALSAAGRHREAEYWRASAAARYEDLTLRHPDAYADHAADFRRRTTVSHPTSLSAQPAGSRPT
ncbi:tetratricopeptide repeat protein [Streptomyces pseudovenezuelae]|nr:hypothetical protein [Streptomyces pseudovenezuelae]